MQPSDLYLDKLNLEPLTSLLEQAGAAAQMASLYELTGVVTDVTGLVIECTGPLVPIGSNVTIEINNIKANAQVVGFRGDRVLLMPYSEVYGIGPGARVAAHDAATSVLVGDFLLGRTVDALGRAIDGKELVVGNAHQVPLYQQPINPVKRKRIEEPFDVGVRAINSLMTIGKGQRIGIFAGSGVGKSTLLGMIARHSKSDINVIALVGERGREVREFIERDLGTEGMKRSVVVVATGNEPALMRIRAANYATAIAEHFRDQGAQVVLMLDSVTRLAMAQREIGLSVGEPPSSRGYTPSVFSMLPKLLERTGTSEGSGAITAAYTVLVDGDDMNEPIADAVRGILDGHIVLSRTLAQRGHYPAIDPLSSTSRVMSDIIPPQGCQVAVVARELLATYKENEDLITIGAYKPGQNLKLDRAVSLQDKLTKFLRQLPQEAASFEDSWRDLMAILVESVQKTANKGE